MAERRDDGGRPPRVAGRRGPRRAVSDRRPAGPAPAAPRPSAVDREVGGAQRLDRPVTRRLPTARGDQASSRDEPPTGLREVTGRQAGAQAGRAAAQSTSRLARAFASRVKRAADADGADESGMSALIGAQALHSAGDALILVALASTVFFDVPLGEARGKVALYLLLTLMPMSLLVPVAGPLLDRFPHGRRNVLGITAIVRAFVAWQLATSLDSVSLFPLALAVLVLSRAYGVARSAALPRVRPPGLTLVAANARMNVAAVLAAGVGAGVGGAVSALAGPDWVLRVAAVVMVAAGLCAIRLPSQIDEDRQVDRARAPAYKLLQGPPRVIRPLVAAVTLRTVAGFLTIFLAFLLRDQDASTQVIGVVVGAVVGGQLIGTALASRLPEHVTRRLTLASLVLPAAGCAVAAVLGGSTWAAVAAGLTGVSYSLSKFALDSSLQSNVPTVSTSGAFTRSETGLQFAFAVGGAVAVVLPPVAALGFAVAALLPVGGTILGARAQRGLPVIPPLGALSPLRRRGPAFTSGAGVTADVPGTPRPRRGRTATGPGRRESPGGGGVASGGGGGVGGRPDQGPRTPDPATQDPDRPWWKD